MTTKEERREIAARLREHVDMRHLYNYQDPDLLGCLITNLTKPHCGISTVGNVLSRLADLIEPEPERTCHQVLTKCNDGLIPPFRAFCDECGDEWGFTPTYCPNCGARVVKE